MKIRKPKDFNPSVMASQEFLVDVKLHDQDEDSTRTKFYFNGEFKGYGVEDEHRDVKIKGETRIPNGKRKLGLRYSPRFSKAYFRDDDYNIIQASKRTTDALKKRFHTEHDLIWVIDVPNFEFVLWHWGNTDDDTDGCYIVGSALATIGTHRGVAASRQKYEEIYPILAKAILDGNAWVNYDR